MPKSLVIVESPAKAKTIRKYAGSDYIVEASVGHICDLPQKPTSGHGVDLETWDEEWEVTKPDVVAKLRKMIKNAAYDKVFLFTDRDREGEAISWHLLRELRLKKNSYSRIRAGEITKTAVMEALANPDSIDMRMVDAQRSRRILDRIVGFDVSGEICQPAGGRSAGRVQTPTLHLICELERKILAFVPKTYFTLGVTYQEGLSAFVPATEESKEDEDSDDGDRPKGRLIARQFPTEAEAKTAEQEGRSSSHVVRSVDRKRTERSPAPPYTTSTMTQDADKKLSLSGQTTMKLAQQLYEAGFITYHRTDSVAVSDVGVALAREYIEREHPEAYATKPRRYQNNERAQEGHECIRPTDLLMNLNGMDLPAGSADLFDMIVARFLASQCRNAAFNKTVIWIDSGSVEWAAEGSVLLDPGFLVYWGRYARAEDVVLPDIQGGQVLTPENFRTDKNSTTPPTRYSEGALTKQMEKLGIGRPSTFAMIVQTLRNRDYIQDTEGGRGKKKYLQPTEKGMQVDEMLGEVFPDILSAEYTSRMEESLDKIADGTISRVEYLNDFYRSFRSMVDAAKSQVAEFCDRHGIKRSFGRNAGEVTDIPCDSCGESEYRKFTVKKPKGSFYRCPKCDYTRDGKAKVKKGKCKAEGCGGNLVEKSNRQGETYAFVCAKPSCNYSEAKDGKPLERKQAKYRCIEAGAPDRDGKPLPEKKCPRCEKQQLRLFEMVVVPADGKTNDFYSCPDSDCKFTLTKGSRARRELCGGCGGLMLERASTKREGSFWECAKCRSRISIS